MKSLLTIIQIIFYLSSLHTTPIDVRPFNQEKQWVINTDCENLVAFKWLQKNGKIFPTEQIKFEVEETDDGFLGFTGGMSINKLEQKLNNLPEGDDQKEEMQSLIKQARQAAGCDDKKLKKQRIHHKRFSKKTKQTQQSQTNAGTYIYMLLTDAHETSRLQNEADGSLQYFDKADKVEELYWNKNNGIVPLNADHIQKKYGLPEDRYNKDYVVKSVTSWERNSGKLPTQKIKEEMQLANENPKSHTPSTSDAAYYFKWKPTNIPEPYTVYHQLNELCVHSKAADTNHRWMIDRGSRESVGGNFGADIWASRIRLVYLGRTRSCTKGLTLKEETYTQNPKPRMFGQLHTPVNDVKFSDVLKFSLDYLTEFPVYNTLINCQHFGTNLYNTLTNKDYDYSSSDIMGIHSDKYCIVNHVVNPVHKVNLFIENKNFFKKLGRKHHKHHLKK